MTSAAAARQGPLTWSCTSDGILVLRYHRVWPSPGDPGQACAALARNGRSGHEIPLLLDLRQLAPGTSTAELRRFLGEVPRLARQIPQRRAYLVWRPDQVDLARMIQASYAPMQIEARVFEAWDDALDWLRHAH
jgi:hypothetical protein